MLKLVVAATLAISAIAANIVPAYADTVVIHTNDHHAPPHHNYNRPMHEHCYTKKVVSWHDGRKVYRTTRVCR